MYPEVTITILHPCSSISSFSYIICNLLVTVTSDLHYSASPVRCVSIWTEKKGNMVMFLRIDQLERDLQPNQSRSLRIAES
jgi:hypothetical protein